MHQMVLILVIVILFLLLAIILNERYKQTNHFSNKFDDSFHISELINSDIKYDILVLGSSQAKYAFDFSELDNIGYNCASRPQHLEINHIILKKSLDHLNESGTVIISLCLLEFFLAKFKNQEDYIKYLPIIDRSDLTNLNTEDFWKNYKLPLIFHPLNFRYFLRDIPHKKILEADGNFCKTQDALIQDAQNWVNLWNNEFSINIPNPEYPDFIKNNIKLNVRILKDIIKTCLNSNAKIVFVIPPVLPYLLNRFDSKFIENNLINNLREAAGNDVILLNYLGDIRFNDPDLYLNSFFLNKKGRLSFTKGVLSDIKNLAL